MDRVVQTELDLIGYIYDAVLHPELWSDTIDRIRRYVGLHLGAIGANYFQSGASIHATTNVSPEALQVMAETAGSIFDLWGGANNLRRLPLEEPLKMLDYSLPEWWPGNPFYERFVKPQGLVDQLTMVLEFSPTAVATFSLGQHESMPPIDDRQVEIFRVIAPHLRRAVLISDLLETRSIEAASFEAALSAVGSSVLLVDARGQIVYANGRAEAMLRARDPIVSLNGKLELPRELVPGQLDRTIAAAALPGETIGPASGIPTRRHDGSGAIIHVLPLERRTDRPRTRAVAAIFVAEPDAELNLPLEGLRVLYDLRPAEVKVLQLVASGLSGRAVADALSVSESTAKTHTLRLFDKVGVHTRAELVAFVRTMSLGV